MLRKIALRALGAGMLLGVACGGPGWAAAAEGSGNQLLAECLEPHSVFGYSYCLGFISGAADTLVFHTNDVCVPEKVTRGQTMDIVVRYLQAHPEIRHYASTTLAKAALMEAFPCRR